MSHNPNVKTIYGMSKEPSGFPNRTDSAVTFDNGSRTLSVTPVSDSFEYYVQGVKYKHLSAATSQITDTEGLWHFYFDGYTLQNTQTFTQAIITDYAYVALVYWDAANNQTIYFGEERHGMAMDGATHVYLHNTNGAVYINGLGLGDFSIDGSGGISADGYFSVANGIIYDEDIIHTITDGSPQDLAPISRLPVFFREGAAGDWRRKPIDPFPVVYPGSVSGYDLSNTLLAYNDFNGTTWSLQEVANNNYVLVHVLATNDKVHPVIAILGTNEYSNSNAARTGATTELATLSGLPFAELVPVGTVIFQTSNGYTNAIKGRIVSTDTGEDYVDFRNVAALPIGQINDHGNLSGLSDADHPATAIYTNTTLFNGNLSSADSTVQAALDTLDNISIISGTGTAGQLAYFTGSQAMGSEAGAGGNSLTWDATNNRLGIGTATPSHVVDVQAGSVASGVYALNVDATLTSGGGSIVSYIEGSVDSGFPSGTPAYGVIGYLSGAGIPSTSYAGNFSTTLAGNGADPVSALQANFALLGSAAGTTASGHNVGVIGLASNSSARNYGLFGNTTGDTAGANIAVTGMAKNNGGGFRVGGLFASQSTGSSQPTVNTSAVLIADNMSLGDPIFLARDNGQTTFSIANDGVILAKNITDSTTAFQVQNSAGTTTVLNVDTTNGRVGIGTASPAARLDVSGSDARVNGITVGRGNASAAVTSTAVGVSALAAATGANNTAIGYQAADVMSTGFANTAVGASALGGLTTSSQSTAVGFSAGGGALTTPNAVTAVGYQALAVTTASSTAVGANAGLALTTGSLNALLGSGALQTATTASQAVAVGAGAANIVAAATANLNSVAVGYVAQVGTTSTGQNTSIGSQAGSTLSGGVGITTGSNLTLLGYNAQPSAATASNEITLGNSSVTTLRCATNTITLISDARDKADVQDISLGLDFLATIRPVQFRWDRREWYSAPILDDEGNTIGYTEGVSDGTKKQDKFEAGFIAQELDTAQVAANAEWMGLALKSNPDRLEATPLRLFPVVVKACQELAAKATAAEVRADAAEARIAALEAAILALS